MKLRTIPVKKLTQRLTSTGTSLYLDSIDDWDDNDLTSSEVPALLYAVLRNTSRTQLELIEIDGTTIADTAITITKRALGYEGGTTADTETAYDWDANETYCELGSNPPQLLDNMLDKDRAQTITGKKTYTTVPDSTAAPTADDNLANKAYVDLTATGLATTDQVLIAGTAGATVAAGDIVYFDVTDKEWKLADASASSTSENVDLGVAQGAGTDGNAISGGVLVKGIDTNQTGMTAGTKQFLSDTAGELSETTGTVEVSIGFSNSGSTTDLVFTPRYDQTITEDLQDALAGTSGTPSVSNLFVTELGFQRGIETYAADAEASDTYVVTLDPVPAAYVAGMSIKVKFNTANTGACTINVNDKGAKAITKNGALALDTDDILAAMIATLVYDGTQFQIQSRIVMTKANADTLVGGGTTTLHEHSNLLGAGSTADKSTYNFNIPFLQGSIGGTTAAAATLWTESAAANTTAWRSGSIWWTPNADANASILTTSAIATLPGYTAASWDNTTKVIVEFFATFKATTGEQGGFGLIEDVAPLIDYDDASKSGVNFSFGTDGKLYGHTSGGLGGAEHTETEITGVTLTANNLYRIEFDPGTDAKLYVNGTLGAEVTTTLPVDGSAIKFGWGASGTATYIRYMTTPYFSIES